MDASPHIRRLRLLLFVALLSTIQMAGAATAPEHAKQRRAGYAGDGACLPCHAAQGNPYRQTAHHLTSQLAGPDSMLGKFDLGEDVLRTANPGLHFNMEARDDGYFQTAVAGMPGMSFRDMTFHSERMDVVIGSGHRAQTYLTWREDQLFELPVSFWLEGTPGWVNSPGYDNGTANFGRTIPPRCLECHAAYIRATAPGKFDNHYDRASFVPGIGCETCHGPGQDHVDHHGTSPQSKTARAILNPASFSRDRQIDLCALCHDGVQRQQSGPAFSYLPGTALDTYLQPNPAEQTTRPDVHGNQVGLLKRSRCFLSSTTMTCSTCHDVHSVERDAASYSGRCLQCHQAKACGMYKAMGEPIAKNCIDCHMPLLDSSAILASRADETIRTKIRTHWIKVYPAE